MSLIEALDEESCSIAVGEQTDLNTEAESWTWIKARITSKKYETTQSDVRTSVATRGAATKPMPGRVWPVLTIEIPAQGQLATYAYASNTPGLTGPNLLLDVFGGAAGIAHQASGISPSDGNTITLNTSTGKYGCLVAGRESSGLVAAMGLVKGLSGGGPFTCNLFEDLKAQPGTNIARIPTWNRWFGTDGASPRSIRWVGEHIDQDTRFNGFFPRSIRKRWDDSWNPWWVLEGPCYGGENPDGGDGGLRAITRYLPIEAMLGGKGRVVLGSNVFTDFNDATVDADGTCAIRELELGITFEHFCSYFGGGTQGVKEVELRKPRAVATFAVPGISDFLVSGAQFQKHAWLELGETSLSVYLGDTPGQILGWNIPRGPAMAWPEPVFIDGLEHWRCALAAGDYDGDDANTDAGDKVFRLFGA